MSIEINDALKEKFIEFCNKNYPNKIRKDNCFNNNKWFYVQVGRFFYDYIHIEYHKNNIELHIEFDQKEENEKFSEFLTVLLPKLNKCDTQKHNKYKWYILENEEKVINEDDLFQKMGKEINEIDEAIEMSEFFIKKYFYY
jgi:hypothetical protein